MTSIMQKGPTGPAALLVRCPATPSPHANQPHSFDDPSLISSAVQPYKVPPSKHFAALNELVIFDEVTIITWLTVLRSIESGFRYRAGRGCLPKQQLEALSVLKDCDDSDISAWLKLILPASQ